jgi:hypothetical protein
MSKEPLNTHENEEDDDDEYDNSSRELTTPELNFKALSTNAGKPFNPNK